VSPTTRKPSRSSSAQWLRFSNLKLEATVFMLIALTFAAVLGQEAITSRQLDLHARAAQYYAFVYGDYQEGGKSTATYDQAAPLKWSCELKAGAQYAYCGYGLHLDVKYQYRHGFFQVPEHQAAPELPGRRRSYAHRPSDGRAKRPGPKRQARRNHTACGRIHRQTG
jgi:hypothetical protein